MICAFFRSNQILIASNQSIVCVVQVITVTESDSFSSKLFITMILTFSSGDYPAQLENRVNLPGINLVLIYWVPILESQAQNTLCLFLLPKFFVTYVTVIIMIGKRT